MVVGVELLGIRSLSFAVGFYISIATTCAISGIVVSAAPATKLTIQTQPSATATVTAPFAQQPVIRVEDQSKDTWQNVELSLPHLREALALGLRLAVVSKWYHLRTVYCLATLLPEAVPFHAICQPPITFPARPVGISFLPRPNGNS